MGDATAEEAASKSERSDPGVAVQENHKAVTNDADRLDDLIDLIGELVIATASATLRAQRSGQALLAEANSSVSHLVEKIRDASLQMRMVAIGETFERLSGGASKAAAAAAKEIDIAIAGAATELDKTVVEQIGEPLMHLVRNAVTFGIEPVETRRALGKAPSGRLELAAFHDSAGVTIEIADDGADLDRTAIRNEAVARGVLVADHPLADDELCHLIFEPDFTGRGTGLAEVRAAIAALRGTISVSSAAGEGVRFAIHLPLTLAIIDGFLTGVAQASYVIPLDAVVECLELVKSAADRDYINLRGEVLPYVRLRDLFDVPGEVPARENIVVVQHDGRKAGIVVDKLLGEFQTVIKPLGSLFRHMRGIGGSTILGSGEVALILDVQTLVSHAAQVSAQIAADTSIHVVTAAH